MIVPRPRLLVWTAALAVPFATLAAAVPGAAGVSALVVAVFLAVILADAFLSRGVFAGITVEMPAVVRLFKDREGVVALQLVNLSQEIRHVRVGLPFPATIIPVGEDLRAVLPAGAERSRLAWRCTPGRRGNYLLEKYYLEMESAWGFWAIRGSGPVRSEIRVYPDLQRERKSVAAIFLNRGSFGGHAVRQVGKGRDFEKLRDYIPGDSFDEIHWKATGKRGRPVTKIFQIERTQEVYVILDASRLSARVMAPAATVPGALPEPPVLDRFISSALVLCLAAERQGDLFGLVTFSDAIHQFVRAKKGQNHFGVCRDALYTLQPRSVTPDFEELFGFIRTRLRRRALLVILTALDDPVLAENFLRHVGLLSRQHLLLVNMVRPPGIGPLFSNAEVETPEDVRRALGGHMRWQDLREIEQQMQHRGAKFSLLENERLTADLVSQYVSVKQRQLI